MSPQTSTSATLTPTTNYQGRELSASVQQQARVTAHYNPDSLKFTVTNQVRSQGRNQPTQVVSQTTAKLSFDLTFDTTTIGGGDVRQTTWKIIQMMAPEQANNQTRSRRRPANKPIKVEFAWGTNRFLGYINSLQETLDFFNDEGVPLRSLLRISMTENTVSFAPVEPTDQQNANNPMAQSQSGQSLDQTLGTQGNSAATRQLAEQNGLESIRNNPGNELLQTDLPSARAATPLAQGNNSSSQSPPAFDGLRNQTSDSSRESERQRPPSQPQEGSPGTATRSISSDTSYSPGGQILGESDSNESININQTQQMGQ